MEKEMIALAMLSFMVILIIARKVFEYIQEQILKQNAETLERDAFIKVYKDDLGEEPAGEFWDAYH